jgi:hypothetical protein
MYTARFHRLLLIGLTVVLALVTIAPVAVLAATSVFATGMRIPQGISRTATGNFYVTDADTTTRNKGRIWEVPANGGSATLRASTGYSLRDNLILPADFGAFGGQLLVVGGDASTNGRAFASTMDLTSFTVTPYASKPRSLWTTPVLATSFGAYSGYVLVTNQGSNKKGAFDGSVDFFRPDGTVGKLVTLASVNVPFGAALAPAGFGSVGGTLLVSDAGGSGIYSVTPTGQVSQFTTIPLGSGQSGLRQIAFAPDGWGRYSGNLFVSVDTRNIYIVNRDGVIVGKIEGAFSPRGMLFTSISGSPSLLFSDTSAGVLRKAGPEDIVPIGD